jgi:2,5-diamino-6-(ribosylamino)-4(3H)-pyrimidinone 5'-phosphate reductase
MLPHVIIHNGVSLDGRMDGEGGGAEDMGLYYELAAQFNADAMLSGSETMLAAYQGLPDAETVEPPAELHPLHVPLLAIVDSRGRIHCWNRLRSEPYWRNAAALCSRSTPQSYLDELRKKRVDFIAAGEEHVDLRAALEELNARYGVKVVRVDSGGVLNGALLRAGLVDEVSLLVGPCLVGGTSPRSLFVAPDLTSPEGVIPLRLTHVERVRGDVVWLCYEVVK